MPGFRGDIRLTRNELDDEIRQPLAEFIGVIRETLDRNRIHFADLAAVASVGGGANIPAVTTALSEHLRVPVITTPRPELTAARGAAIRAARGPANDSRTAVAAVAVVAPDLQAPSSGFPALAWSRKTTRPTSWRQSGVSMRRRDCAAPGPNCVLRPPTHDPADPVTLASAGTGIRRW